MDPVPDIGKTPPPAYNEPSGGPASNQRQAVQAHRRRITRKKQQQANETPDCIPGSGPPGENPVE